VQASGFIELYREAESMKKIMKKLTRGVSSEYPEPVDLVKEVEGRYSIHFSEEVDGSDKAKYKMGTMTRQFQGPLARGVQMC